MKKLFVILLSLFFIVGCENQEQVVNSNIEENNNIETVEKVEETKYCNVEITDENREDIEKLKNEKYFICNNLEKYLSYVTLHDLSATEVIREVNVGLYRGYYEDMVATDVSKNYLMIVNKYYYLTGEFEPDDLETISNGCNGGGNPTLRHDARVQFENLCNDAKKLGLNIHSVSAYRSYATQVRVYNSKVQNRGQAVADTISARPGNSEHQTGLTLDVNQTSSEFAKTNEYTWLQNNAYKYGFIERYPKDDVKITGYDWEPWHYRYIGIEEATKLHEEGITFDEYYAYYVENN